MITPAETARLREFMSNLDRCSHPAAVNAYTHAAAHAWRPVSDGLAEAMGQIAALHRRRLDGELDAEACASGCERLVMSASGAVQDMFGGAG